MSASLLGRWSNRLVIFLSGAGAMQCALGHYWIVLAMWLFLAFGAAATEWPANQPNGEQ